MKVTNIKLYEILSREAYVFHAEGRIHMKKLIVAFRTFENAYKKRNPSKTQYISHSSEITPAHTYACRKEKEARWVRESIIDYSLSIDPLIHNIS